MGTSGLCGGWPGHTSRHSYRPDDLQVKTRRATGCPRRLADDRNAKSKPAALTGFAFQVNRASMFLNQVPRNCEAQSGSLMPTRLPLPHLVELIEYGLQFGGRDTDPCVRN